MAQLSTIITTEDSDFRNAVAKLVRSSGVPVGIMDEGESESAVAPAVALVDVRTDANGLAKVERLRTRWPAVSIMAVAGASDPDLILQAMRAGANEFFAWPPDGSPPSAMEEGVCAAIRRAAQRLQTASPDSQQGCRTITFFGAKGGAGTTTMAVSTVSQITCNVAGWLICAI